MQIKQPKKKRVTGEEERQTERWRAGPTECLQCASLKEAPAAATTAVSVVSMVTNVDKIKTTTK